MTSGPSGTPPQTPRKKPSMPEIITGVLSGLTGGSPLKSPKSKMPVSGGDPVSAQEFSPLARKRTNSSGQSGQSPETLTPPIPPTPPTPIVRLLRRTSSMSSFSSKKTEYIIPNKPEEAALTALYPKKAFNDKVIQRILKLGRTIESANDAAGKTPIIALGMGIMDYTSKVPEVLFLKDAKNPNPNLELPNDGSHLYKLVRPFFPTSERLTQKEYNNFFMSYKPVSQALMQLADAAREMNTNPSQENLTEFVNQVDAANSAFQSFKSRFSISQSSAPAFLGNLEQLLEKYIVHYQGIKKVLTKTDNRISDTQKFVAAKSIIANTTDIDCMLQKTNDGQSLNILTHPDLKQTAEEVANLSMRSELNPQTYIDKIPQDSPHKTTLSAGIHKIFSQYYGTTEVYGQPELYELANKFIQTIIQSSKISSLLRVCNNPPDNPSECDFDDLFKKAQDRIDVIKNESEFQSLWQGIKKIKTALEKFNEQVPNDSRTDFDVGAILSDMSANLSFAERAFTESEQPFQRLPLAWKQHEKSFTSLNAAKEIFQTLTPQQQKAVLKDVPSTQEVFMQPVSVPSISDAQMIAHIGGELSVPPASLTTSQLRISPTSSQQGSRRQSIEETPAAIPGILGADEHMDTHSAYTRNNILKDDIKKSVSSMLNKQPHQGGVSMDFITAIARTTSDVKTVATDDSDVKERAATARGFDFPFPPSQENKALTKEIIRQELADNPGLLHVRQLNKTITAMPDVIDTISHILYDMPKITELPQAKQRTTIATYLNEKLASPSSAHYLERTHPQDDTSYNPDVLKIMSAYLKLYNEANPPQS